ncbi:MAG: hypothetical protein CL678_16045 [Bdellovibrionaceae bacterium]|nr:hypothetical protein [Pseudobdellovibrionaceae bacterium]|tara:strand:- start:383 stop:754 length:372 start_codon:yes stop_codon:yes gene_type:complete
MVNKALFIYDVSCLIEDVRDELKNLLERFKVGDDPVPHDRNGNTLNDYIVYCIRDRLVELHYMVFDEHRIWALRLPEETRNAIRQLDIREPDRLYGQITIPIEYQCRYADLRLVGSDLYIHFD